MLPLKHLKEKRKLGFPSNTSSSYMNDPNKLKRKTNLKGMHHFCLGFPGQNSVRELKGSSNHSTRAMLSKHNPFFFYYQAISQGRPHCETTSLSISPFHGVPNMHMSMVRCIINDSHLKNHSCLDCIKRIWNLIPRTREEYDQMEWWEDINT